MARRGGTCPALSVGAEQEQRPGGWVETPGRPRGLLTTQVPSCTQPGGLVTSSCGMPSLQSPITWTSQDTRYGPVTPAV